MTWIFYGKNQEHTTEAQRDVAATKSLNHKGHKGTQRESNSAAEATKARWERRLPLVFPLCCFVTFVVNEICAQNTKSGPGNTESRRKQARFFRYLVPGNRTWFWEGERPCLIPIRVYS